MNLCFSNINLFIIIFRMIIIYFNYISYTILKIKHRFTEPNKFLVECSIETLSDIISIENSILINIVVNL